MKSIFPQFFKTIHSDNKAVGDIGDGSHYSVLRSTTWYDNSRLLLNEPMIHDFAIIWDKDHDNRIIEFVEHMFMNNVLSPVLFVGESKEHLTVFVSPLFRETTDEHVFQDYVSSVVELAKNQYVPWTAEVCVFGEALTKHQIIDSSNDRVELFLKNINMLWNLGLKDFRVGLCRPDLYAEPIPEIM